MNNVLEVATPAGAPASPVVEPGQLDRETRDVVRKAKELLLNQGWCRGPMGMPYDPNHDGRLCIAGAIHAASDCDDSCSDNSYTLAAEVFGFANEGAVWLWNDAQGRTQADVIDRIDKALGA
jgi:hypothetical protein